MATTNSHHMTDDVADFADINFELDLLHHRYHSVGEAPYLKSSVSDSFYIQTRYSSPQFQDTCACNSSCVPANPRSRRAASLSSSRGA